MIFGKTHEERLAAQDAWVIRFAYVPVRLHDGRWLWRQSFRRRFSSSDPAGRAGRSLGRRVQRMPMDTKETN